MERLKYIISKFPKQIDFCFAYGSAVKKQANYRSNSMKMIDLIFCVKNSEQWHKDNLSIHPTHYSMMKIFGASFIARVQENLSAKCYFNTLVPFYFPNGEKCMIKYGVILKNHLIDDLLNWKYLYIAGRLQKPIEIIYQLEDDQELKIALRKNLESAVHTALLLLPTKFNDFDLFYTIANLSYRGDFRMVFGENKQKVENIVQPQLDKFYNLYLPILQNMSFCLSTTSGDKMKFQQEKSQSINKIHLEKLPNEVQQRVLRYYSFSRKNKSEMLEIIAKDRNFTNVVANSIRGVVRKSSILQSLKNIPTAGFSKTVVYSWQKSVKTFS